MKTKPKPLTINLNAKVRVHLTKHGKAVYQAWHVIAIGELLEAPDVFEDQLWELCRIFSGAMTIGAIPLFKNNMIEVIGE